MSGEYTPATNSLTEMQLGTVTRIVENTLFNLRSAQMFPQFYAFAWACVHATCTGNDNADIAVRVAAARKLRWRHECKQITDEMARQDPNKLGAGYADVLYTEAEFNARHARLQEGYGMGWSEQELEAMKQERRRQMKMIAALRRRGFKAYFDDFYGHIVVGRQPEWANNNGSGPRIAKLEYEFRTGQMELEAIMTCAAKPEDVGSMAHILERFESVMREVNAAGQLE